jgi:hypothetical protein
VELVSVGETVMTATAGRNTYEGVFMYSYIKQVTLEGTMIYFNALDCYGKSPWDFKTSFGGTATLGNFLGSIIVEFS